MSFVAPLSVGAVLLAVWVDERLESRRPGSLAKRAIHAAVAWGLLQIVVVVVAHLLPDQASDLRRVVVVLGLFLPSLVYTFVTALWLVRLLAEVATISRR
jgi:hypothetical protein